MTSNHEAERRRRPSVKGAILVLVVVIAVVLTAWTLVTVSTASQIPRSAFVTLPTTPVSKKGESAKFVSISSITQKGVADGVTGYLKTISGQPIVGAKVYVQYYYQDAYRTQVATTDPNGHFDIHFPLNWTGSLPVTFTYFGDDQHQGLTLLSSVSGESL